MDMCVQKFGKFLILLAVTVLFAGCDVMDSLFSSAGAYKINAQIDGVPLNECSFILVNNKITPFFEESVSGDIDITSLIVQLRNNGEDISDWGVYYSLRKESQQYRGAIQVESMDKDLPFFILPADLPMGLYSMVFKIMSGSDVLQRTEREFYYLGNAAFSYEGIDVHLPGISNNSQLVSRGQVIMLEAKLNFDESLDPYIVWYNGKSKIANGRYSEGAEYLLWRAPDYSDFYTFRAEVFPVNDFDSLAGYKRNIFVPVSSNTVDVNLISEKIPELRHWYVFDGNLNDSTTSSPVEHRAISNSNRNRVRWMSANGTYGLAAGTNNNFALPKAELTARDSWQMLFRFKPINEGSLMSVDFISVSSNVVMDLSISEEKLFLTLSSPANTVSRTYNLPSNMENFLTMGINFSVSSGQVLAKVNVLGNKVEQDESAQHPIFLEASGLSDFQVVLGSLTEEETAASVFTAVWDEFALYNNPSMNVIAAEIRSTFINLASIYE